MANQSLRSRSISRRQFLQAAAATAYTVSTAQTAPAQTRFATIAAALAEPPRTDLQALNCGLITAWRPELSAAANRAHQCELWHALAPFGRLDLRGRYNESDGTADARPRAIEAYFVIGRSDDSGNLKGMLRKLGRKYQQDAMIYKANDRDAELHALRDLPQLGLAGDGKLGLGRFRPEELGSYYILMTRAATGALPPPGGGLALDGAGRDWLGGRWEEIGLFTPPTFFNRTERRMGFDAAGNLVRSDPRG